MTVIRKKQNYVYPKPTSTTASDTESLHLGSVSASDTESVNEAPITASRQIRSVPIKLSNLDEVTSIRKFGKKRLRRYQNRCVLQTLNEDDEENEYIVVMEPYKTPFARLLENSAALEYWQNFIEKSEKQQKEIIEAFSKSVQNNNKDITKPGRISSRIKKTFKIRKNLSIDSIKGCEDDLILFFKSTPSGIYVRDPPTSFDRLLLHGIAQYHKLTSISVIPENGVKRSVEVYNNNKNWVPAKYFLSDFIKQMRNIQ